MTQGCPGAILGISDDAKAIRGFVEEAAHQVDPVVLMGEPGTGKQLAARLIHEGSSRREGPFIMLDCSLYYERELRRELFGYHHEGEDGEAHKGLLEFAAHGTCYLSRIEEISPSIQQSLLHFLEHGSFQRLGDGKETPSGVRLVVSSDKNLKGFVDAGLFDLSLYEALSRLSACFCPLRERKEDIPCMVDFMVDNFTAIHGGKEKISFSPEAFEALKAYPWPLNFDELEKEILRLLEAGLKTVRCENLAMEISSFWIGQRGDPEVRKVIEELDGCIREFKVMSRLHAGLGEDVSGWDPWALLPSWPQRDFIGEP